MAKVVKKKTVAAKGKPEAPKSKWASHIAKMKKHWSSAREQAEEGGDFGSLPAGKYICRLVGAELGQSESSGRMQIHWQHKVVKGEELGTVQHSWDGVDTPESLVWLARKLSRLGVEMGDDTLDNLEDTLSEIVAAEPLVRITVKENGEFTNVYLDKLLDEDETETDEGNGDESSSEEETEVEAGGEDEVSYEDIMEMPQKDLVTLIKDNELTTKTNIPINTMRKKVCEELGLEPAAEGETEAETESEGEEGGDEEFAVGGGVIFLHQGKTTQAKIVKINGDKLKVKTKGGQLIDVAAVKCESFDVPF